MNIKPFALPLLLTALAPLARAEVIRVVREPRQVASVTAKTESAWATCRWCTGKISYNRTYKWDVYDRCWVETTQSVPDACRKCRAKDKELEKLRREEANLDRKLTIRETKKRVAEKRERLRNWTAENR